MTAFMSSMLRGRPAILLALIAWVLWAPPDVVAHRLDECLQAARIAVFETRVEIELDLTPGANMADRFLALIDLDRDGRISNAEGEAFGERVKNSVTLTLDGVAKLLEVAVEELPRLEDIKAGTGVIRLRLSAGYPALSPGPHRIAFQNRYRPNESVHLVNALVPESARIQIIRQRRDPSQRDYDLEVSVR